MKPIIASFFLLVVIVTACQKSNQSSQETIPTDSVQTQQQPLVSLEKKWETDTVLTTCESVLYDKERDVLYVSNINGIPDAKDGNGFISKVSLKGDIIEAQW